MDKKLEEQNNGSQDQDMVYYPCPKCGERVGYPKWTFALESPIVGWRLMCPKCKKFLVLTQK